MPSPACWRWTEGAPLELALVVPIVGSGAQSPVAIGVGDATSVEMRIETTLRIALGFGAQEFVVAHNHVSGRPPSGSDFAVTRRLVAAAAIVGLRVGAHLVLTDCGWYDCLASEPGLTQWARADVA